MANKPVTGLTQWGGQTTGSTGDLDANFTALTAAINDFNTYSNFLVAAGTANALTASLGANLTGALTDGMVVQLRASNTNTGAATFAYNGGGAVQILGAGLSPLTISDIVQNSIITLQYSAAAGPAWILQDTAIVVNTFTPTLTFETPGDLTVNYSQRVGRYTKNGRNVNIELLLTTSTFTHTTASGNAQITGFPFTNNSASEGIGAISFQGISKANYTSFFVRLQGSSTTALIGASGQGQTDTTLTPTDMPTGGTVIIRSNFSYSV